MIQRKKINNDIKESEQLRGARVAAYLLPFIIQEMVFFIVIEKFLYHGGVIFSGLSAIIISLVVSGLYFSLFIYMHILAFREYNKKLSIFKIILIMLFTPFIYFVILTVILNIYIQTNDIQYGFWIDIGLLVMCFLAQKVYNWKLFKELS